MAGSLAFQEKLHKKMQVVENRKGNWTAIAFAVHVYPAC